MLSPTKRTPEQFAVFEHPANTVTEVAPLAPAAAAPADTSTSFLLAANQQEYEQFGIARKRVQKNLFEGSSKRKKCT
jgi:hypothetical protein